VAESRARVRSHPVGETGIDSGLLRVILSPQGFRLAMSELSRALTLALSTACLLCSQQAPPKPTASFASETRLVLVPFNVQRGAYFAADVNANDIVLLEDGKSREFSIFEGPGTGRRPPLELTLLFDTTTLPPPELKIKVLSHWDRKATYDFASHWNDTQSRAVLEKGGADVRVAIYRYDNQQLQRLCVPTKDPQVMTRSIQRLPEPMRDEEARALTLPKGRTTIEDAIVAARRGFKRGPNDAIILHPGWTLEAVIDTLKDSATTESRVMRAAIVFSEKVGPTTTQPADVANEAKALGIPVYPVVLDFDEYVRKPFTRGGLTGGGVVPGATPIPRHENEEYDPSTGLRTYVPAMTTLDTVPMVRFGSLGELTGGASIYPARLDAETVNQILNIVRDHGLSQYIVGFTPPTAGTRKKHTLEIKLKSKATGKLVGGTRAAVY
jgi:hypothetical protein